MPRLTDAPRPLSLRCHHSAACSGVREITVELASHAARQLVLHYTIVGERSQLSVPTAESNLDPARLWEHTCCELFVAARDGDDYSEWNFSPSGQYTQFDFASYRKPRQTSEAANCELLWEDSPDALAVQVRLSVPESLGTTLCIGIACVIEDTTGVRSYWALQHPCERPDFHHRDGFALAFDLDSPRLAPASPHEH